MPKKLKKTKQKPKPIGNSCSIKLSTGDVPSINIDPFDKEYLTLKIYDQYIENMPLITAMLTEQEVKTLMICLESAAEEHWPKFYFKHPTKRKH
jgi:hypothetical protein